MLNMGRLAHYHSLLTTVALKHNNNNTYFLRLGLEIISQGHAQTSEVFCYMLLPDYLANIINYTNHIIHVGLPDILMPLCRCDQVFFQKWDHFV